MSLFRWPFSQSSNLDSKECDQGSALSFTTPVDLVSRIQKDYLKLQELDALCESQTKAIHRLTTEMSALHTELTADKARHGKEMTALHDAATRRKKELRKVRTQLLSTEAGSAELSNTLRDVNHQLIELKFENELLKCTTITNDKRIDTHTDSLAPKAQTVLPSTPFVVVLIDGDAYLWNSDHYNVKHTTPGAHAAQCVKEEVQKYLMANSDRVPLQSKIVVRAVCNAGDSRRLPGTKKRRPTNEEFMLRFTESMPLFDFFDAGKGKERADEKLKENFHLFISNPHCYTVFFAGCTDNGFARLLEQYCNNPKARQKIVLVHPGYITGEIERLNLVNCEWPRVFARRLPPQSELSKVHRNENKHLEMERMKAVAQQEGERKHGKARYARILLENAVATRVMELYDLNTTFRSTTGFGLCSTQRPQAKDIEAGSPDYREGMLNWDIGID